MEENVVGKRVPQVDSWLKVTGTLRYSFDIELPGQLYVALVTSRYAHARIRSVDTSDAIKSPGIVGVFTGKDFPFRIGLYIADRDLLATNKVRWVGHPVAAVVGTSMAAAEEAAEKVSVDYEPLEPVLDVEKAIEKGAPLVHEDMASYNYYKGFINPVPGTNIANDFRLVKGDVSSGFAESNVIVEETFKIPQINHAPMEVQNVLAYWRPDDYVEVWTSAQSPFATRYLTAASLNIPVNRLIVHVPPAGGGFGLKAGIGWEPLAIMISKSLRRPVKLVLSRSEQMTSAPSRDGLVANVKAGFSKDGRFKAYEATFMMDAGAYADYTVNVARTTGYSADGAYDIENISVKSLAIYTNKIPTTAMRGFGHPENHWPLEQVMDRAADMLGLDPVKIREINLHVPGKSVRGTGEPVREYDGNPRGVLEALVKGIGYWEVEKPSEPWKVRAKGLAMLVKAPSQPPNAGASAIVKIDEDGTIDVITGTGSMGQGTPTSLAIIAAEAFGVPVEKVKVNQLEGVSTDQNPYTWQTVGSRGLYSDGIALLRAIEDAKNQIREMASAVFRVPKDDIEIRGGQVYPRTHPEHRLGLKDFAMGYTYPNGNTIGGPVIGRGSYAPVLNTFLDEKGHGHNTVFHTYGGTAVEVEIDLLTGEVRVIKVVQAFDVGRVINLLTLEGQAFGGFIMGMGSALYEEIKFDKQGWVLNPNLTHYYVPRITDLPDEIDAVFLETPQMDGPLGARGIGEHVMIAVAPAISNAIYRGLKVKLNEIPMNAERVWKAIKEQRPELISSAFEQALSRAEEIHV